MVPKDHIDMHCKEKCLLFLRLLCINAKIAAEGYIVMTLTLLMFCLIRYQKH